MFIDCAENIIIEYNNLISKIKESLFNYINQFHNGKIDFNYLHNEIGLEYFEFPKEETEIHCVECKSFYHNKVYTENTIWFTLYDSTCFAEYVENINEIEISVLVSFYKWLEKKMNNCQ